MIQFLNPLCIFFLKFTEVYEMIPSKSEKSKRGYYLLFFGILSKLHTRKSKINVSDSCLTISNLKYEVETISPKSWRSFNLAANSIYHNPQIFRALIGRKIAFSFTSNQSGGSHCRETCYCRAVDPTVYSIYKLWTSDLKKLFRKEITFRSIFSDRYQGLRASGVFSEYRSSAEAFHLSEMSKNC